MTSRQTAYAAAAGSAALLIGALAFQYLGGLPPCKLCYWQRYPHAAAALIGLAIAVVPARWLTLAGAAAALTTGAIGIYHVGVEQGWWPGPDTCSSGPVGGLTPGELLDQIMAAPVVRCDEIAWQMLGISMAGWNAIASAVLALMWVAAWRAAAGPARAA